MEDTIIYFVISIATASLGVFAAISAVSAMRRGLTYSVLHATTILLTVFALASLWHTLREFLGLEDEWAEFLEYGLRSGAFFYFIVVAMRSARLSGPTEKK